MTVYGITVVKDEADIIEVTLRHMAAEVDRLIVGDNNSTDGTREILDRLASELAMTVVDEPKPGHHQDERMTRYAQQAYEQGATWVVPFDADEIWYSDQGPIRDVLAVCPDGLGVLNCRGFDHIARNDGPWSPWRVPELQPLPKVAFRAADGVKVAMGNHSCEHPLPSGEGPVAYRHYQYRCFDQLKRKVREGTRATDQAGHDTDTDFHWRELAAMSDVELRARWLITTSQPGLVFDPAPIRRPVSVSVVVPTLDRTDLLEECLASVDATADVEVVVGFDNNRDGFAHTCNLAAKEATGDVLVFLNDDTVCRPGWLEALTRRVDHGVVGAMLAYPDDTVQHAGVFLRRRDGVVEAFNCHKPLPSGEVPAVTGACLAITRGLWDELGGFDEGFVNGYEDVDLCLRARRAGRSVFFAADCVVTHLESQSPGRFVHAQENIALLQERWGQQLEGVV